MIVVVSPKVVVVPPVMLFGRYIRVICRKKLII